MGIGGAVAVGKSTLAAALAGRLEQAGRRPAVVSTDAFLLPNAELDRRGLILRKGFPETYDTQAMESFVRAMRDQGAARVPVYSHASYDVIDGAWELVRGVDVVILEGVMATQPPLADLVDLTIYLHAEEPVVRGWFVERFLDLTVAARRDPGSFYAMFAGLGPQEVRAVAEGTWDGINALNLANHILPSREKASVVVDKDAEHRVVSIRASTVGR